MAAKKKEPADFHSELEAAFDAEPKVMGAAVGAPGGGLLRAVFQGLAGEGVRVTGLSQWIAIASLVIELVTKYGPDVAELVKQIRERLGI